MTDPIATAFAVGDIVRHRNGGLYIIEHGPDTARIESTGKPAYIYRAADQQVLWCRSAVQMEDGRFVLEVPARAESADPIATVREAQRLLYRKASDSFRYHNTLRGASIALDTVVAEIERLRAKVVDADLCLQAVGEARQVLHDHFGGNIAFLDDDLIRGVVKMHEETERQAQEIAALRRKHDALLYAVAKLSAWEMASSLNVVPPRTPAELADLERTHQEAVQQVLVAAGLRDAVRDKEAQR